MVVEGEGEATMTFLQAPPKRRKWAGVFDKVGRVRIGALDKCVCVRRVCGDKRVWEFDKGATLCSTHLLEERMCWRNSR